MSNIKPENIYAELLQSAKMQDQGVTPELRFRLHEKLSELSSEKKDKGLNLKMVLAIAASVIVVFSLIMTIGYGHNGNSVQRTLVYESTVGSGKPVTIKLRYNSKSDLENVSFSIDLDEGVSFFSKNSSISSLRSHSWKGSLKKGDNEIPFVVKTSRMGMMKIRTKAQYSDFSFIHEIVLNADESSVNVSMFAIGTADN